MEEAKQELHRIINDREMKDSLLLVFANKQDLENCELAPACLSFSNPTASNLCCALLTHLTPTALNPTQVTERLNLNSLKDKLWFVVPSCATTGEGLLEGLAWLSSNVKTPAAPAKK